MIGDTLEGTEYVTLPLAYFRLHGRSKMGSVRGWYEESFGYFRHVSCRV